MNFLNCVFVILLSFSCTETSDSKKINILNSEVMNENSVLIEAVKSRDVERVVSVLKTNPNLESKDSSGKTALMIAAYNEDNTIAELLINAGANVNAQDKMLNSPFLYAGAEGNIKLLELGLENGADFNVFNRYGGTALIPAAERGHLEIVKILVEVPNYPIDHINKLGWTALMEAVILAQPGAQQIAVINTLIQAGSDVNIPDGDGVSPLTHAKNKALNEVVKILKEAGAK